MNKQVMTRQDGRKHHYAVERAYVQRILLSSKGSVERTQLFDDAYNEISRIKQAYDSGGVETPYKDVVVSIIRELLKPGSRVFDIGCASGDLIIALLEGGYEASLLFLKSLYIF